MSPAEQAQAEAEYDAVEARTKAVRESSWRDHFARAALTGILAHRNNGYMYPENAAAEAYRFADAMMAARGPK